MHGGVTIVRQARAVVPVTARLRAVCVRVRWWGGDMQACWGRHAWCFLRRVPATMPHARALIDQSIPFVVCRVMYVCNRTASSIGVMCNRTEIKVKPPHPREQRRPPSRVVAFRAQVSDEPPPEWRRYKHIHTCYSSTYKLYPLTGAEMSCYSRTYFLPYKMHAES